MQQTLTEAKLRTCRTEAFRQILTVLVLSVVGDVQVVRQFSQSERKLPERGFDLAMN